jgi:hypothetical protein
MDNHICTTTDLGRRVGKTGKCFFTATEAATSWSTEDQKAAMVEEGQM